MQTVSHNVFTGADNEIKLTLTEDEAAMADHTVITRMTLVIGPGDTLLSAAPYTTLDSDVTAALFDLTNTGYVALLLGNAGLAPGRHIARMKIYSANYPNGADWMPLLELRVV